MLSLSTSRRFVVSVCLFTLLSSLISLTTGYRLHKRSIRPSPVIFVPGDGGSQLQAKLNKPETVHYYCNKKTDYYFDLWLNLELLVPYVLDCWIDNMRLVYNNVTRTTSNAPGVDIKVPGFGNTSTVEWLDPSEIAPSAYFVRIVQGLVDEGYTRAVDLKGAPYDYRKAPNEMADYFKAVKQMTEGMYNDLNQTRITYICHSMGCPIMLYFFNRQTQEWKDTHVKALITLGGAWGGAVKALKAFASGENLGVYVINHLLLRKEQRTSPSLAYMIPSDTFWKKDEILVVTEKQNYTVGNYYDFFQDIGFPVGWEMWKDTYNLTRDLIPPGVEVHCMHGVNVPTIERLVYKHLEFPDSNPTLIQGDGDGTVNLRSLEGCLRWKGLQKQKIVHKPLKKVDHMGVLYDDDVIQYIKQVVSS